jgi:predicted dienelactone hydrolase
VLADPLLPQVFTPAGLQRVIVPIQLWASERSGDDPVIGVTEQGVADLRDRLPSQPGFHLVSGAGHFAFLAPCPSTIAQRAPRFCVDVPGFDRVVVHNQLDAAIVAFFKQHLPAVRR